MGNRLTRIYTRTGDGGTTGLADGSRVAKDTARMEALGSIDELNSVLGLVLTEALPEDVRALLTRAQHDLFDLGGELAIPGSQFIKPEHATRLEQAIDRYNEDLAPLKEFILPGGSVGASYCHLARTVCRRAERALVALAHEAQVSSAALAYLNRMSDILFVVCRVLNRHASVADVYWQKSASNG